MGILYPQSPGGYLRLSILRVIDGLHRSVFAGCISNAGDDLIVAVCNAIQEIDCWSFIASAFPLARLIHSPGSDGIN